MTIRRVVGTAGHIDHGKTELVRALTGVDTDRLKEEKERKISIDLGFAPLDLPGGVRAAVVDVPGHERFVKNMLAGVGGIDAVLFVIAADEGVMPQTAEHLEIVHYLGISAGVIVLTKSDLVDGEMLELVREDVAEAFAATTLGRAPVLAASSITGEGVPEVARALAEVLEKAPPRFDSGWFRQPVDRVFSSRGFGTVVTGTVWSGRARTGNRLELLPQGKEVRIRKIEVFNHDVEEAHPGERTALALHGVAWDEVGRGDTLVEPGILRPTHMLDARISLAPSARELKNRQRIRFHHGAAEVLGRVVLLEGEKLAPGDDGYAQLRLEEAVVVARGDRFILRTYSPARTMGGGMVLDAAPQKRRPAGRSDLEFLRISEAGDREEMVRSILRSSHRASLPAVAIARRLQLPPAEAERLFASLSEGGSIRVLSGAVVLGEDAASLSGEIARRLQDASTADKLEAGLPREVVRKSLSRDVDLPLFQALMDEMAREGKVTLLGDRILAGHGGLPARLRRAAEKIDAELGAHRFTPPSPARLADLLDIDRKELGRLLDTLGKLGRIVKITPALVYRSEEIEAIAGLIRGILEERGAMTVADFKDRVGVSRKFAVPLLEYYDNIRLTRREGDRRLPGSAFSGGGEREDD